MAQLKTNQGPIFRPRLSMTVDLLTQEIEQSAVAGDVRRLQRIRDQIVAMEMGRLPWWWRLMLRSQ